ncbi:hypothetical protein J5N97_028212 [Dioscorea zingiberensis]|uniref:Uncharacterized protein n=1 Tax=Dioscorea zingiberensis TaxID=325984 RepID=A0A9D5H4H6_9LILI|nr:hypothetical protein J5N97_028212 [Dioscorea zingiberensis]
MTDPFAFDADLDKLSLSHGSGIVCSSSSSSMDRASVPFADAPILFYSPPNSLDAATINGAATTVDEADSANAAANAHNTATANVATTTDAAIPDLGLPPSPALESPKENPAEGKKYRHQSLEILEDVLVYKPPADGRRKLPASLVNHAGAEVRGNHPKVVNLSRDLAELAKYFSDKIDKSVGDIDILDIAKMKGIELPPLSWWRPGGYEAKKVKEPVNKEPANKELANKDSGSSQG